MRRSTSPRCRTPPSGRIVLRVERGKPTSSGFSDWKTLDLGGFLQKMLHGMARLRLVEEEGHLPFVEAEVRGEVGPPNPASTKGRGPSSSTSRRRGTPWRSEEQQSEAQATPKLRL